MLAVNQLIPLGPFGYDKEVMESFFSSLKQELMHHERFVDRDEARGKVFDSIEIFHNRQLLHSSLDYQSPVLFEKMAVSPKHPVRKIGGSPP